MLNGKPVKKYIAEQVYNAMGVTKTREFREQVGRMNLSKCTVQHYHRLVSPILSTAVLWQIIPDNPAKRVKPPRAPRQAAKCLDEQQAAVLLELLQNEPNKYQVIVKLLIYSGMRKGELCGIVWKD